MILLGYTNNHAVIYSFAILFGCAFAALTVFRSLNHGFEPLTTTNVAASHLTASPALSQSQSQIKAQPRLVQAELTDESEHIKPVSY